MANLCSYLMKVVGSEENVKEFYDAMNWQGKYVENGVGRVYDAVIDDEGLRCDGEYFMEIDGSCAWSIISAMRMDNDDNNIVKLSERLGLAIEVYSEESGFEFQEHFFVDNGEIQIDECIDYTEISYEDIDEISDEWWQQDWVVASGITKENAKDHVVDDYVRIGGYSEWNFEI